MSIPEASSLLAGTVTEGQFKIGLEEILSFLRTVDVSLLSLSQKSVLAEALILELKGITTQLNTNVGYIESSNDQQNILLTQLRTDFNGLIVPVAQSNNWTDLLILLGDGSTQREFNNELIKRRSNLFNLSKLVQSITAANLSGAVANKRLINVDADITFNTTPITVPSNAVITGQGQVLNQTSQSTKVLDCAYGSEKSVISGLSLVQDKTTAISGGINNNHTMIKVHGKYHRVENNNFDGQYGVSLAYGEAISGNPTFNRAHHFSRIVGNLVTDVQGMAFELIGASYCIVASNLVDSVSKAVFHGVRLTGYDNVTGADTINAPNLGNVGSSNVFRNVTNGIAAQNASKFAHFTAMHFNKVTSAIFAYAGTNAANNPSMHWFDFTASEVERVAVLDQLNHSNIGFVADGGSLTDTGIEEISGLSGVGFNYYYGLIKNALKTGAQFRYSHNMYNLRVSSSVNSGIIISGNNGAGVLIVNDAKSTGGAGVSIFGNGNNLKIVSTNNVNLALNCAGNDNIIEVVTIGNVLLSGNDNVISANVTGDLNIVGTGNIIRGKVTGTVSRTDSSDPYSNNYSQLKGFNGLRQISTTVGSAGQVALTIDKHASAQVRALNITILSNTSNYRCVIRAISGSNVTLRFEDSAGVAVATGTAISFFYHFTS